MQEPTAKKSPRIAVLDNDIDTVFNVNPGPSRLTVSKNPVLHQPIVDQSQDPNIFVTPDPDPEPQEPEPQDELGGIVPLEPVPTRGRGRGRGRGARARTRDTVPVPVTRPAPTDPVPVSGPVTLSQSTENIFSIFGKINPMHIHYQV